MDSNNLPLMGLVSAFVVTATVLIYAVVKGKKIDEKGNRHLLAIIIVALGVGLAIFAIQLWGSSQS